jgi:hypothetical protein
MKLENRGPNTEEKWRNVSGMTLVDFVQTNANGRQGFMRTAETESSQIWWYPLSIASLSKTSPTYSQPQSRNIKWKISEIIILKINNLKQVLKSGATMCSAMKSHAIQLCPPWDMNHPLVQCIHAIEAARSLVGGHLGYQIDCHSS